MVSTRHHPRAFPEPASPTVRSTRITPSKASSSSPRPTSPSPTSSSAPTNTVTPAIRSAPAPRKRKSITNTTATSSSLSSYTHAIDPITIAWLLVSLPLIFWDTFYVLLRPHTMPGGRLHSPFWTPYALYGTIDYMYGWPAWNDGVGFTAAQGSLNAVEAAMYIYYLYVLVKSAKKGERAEVVSLWKKDFWTEPKLLGGEGMAGAVVICFAAAVMTVSKTALYWLNEYFSKFENIGHNSWSTLFWLWIIPNGAWLVVPSYMIYALGTEIVGAMHLAGGSTSVKAD